MRYSCKTMLRKVDTHSRHSRVGSITRAKQTSSTRKAKKQITTKNAKTDDRRGLDRTGPSRLYPSSSQELLLRVHLGELFVDGKIHNGNDLLRVQAVARIQGGGGRTGEQRVGRKNPRKHVVAARRTLYTAFKPAKLQLSGNKNTEENQLRNRYPASKVSAKRKPRQGGSPTLTLLLLWDPTERPHHNAESWKSPLCQQVWPQEGDRVTCG